MVGRGSRRERDEAFLQRMYSYINLHIVWDNSPHPKEHSTHTSPHTNHLFVSYCIMKWVEFYSTNGIVPTFYDPEQLIGGAKRVPVWSSSARHFVSLAISLLAVTAKRVDRRHRFGRFMQFCVKIDKSCGCYLANLTHAHAYAFGCLACLGSGNLTITF